MAIRRRPNILLILSDQHRADCLGVDGHPLLQTPNLDNLAQMGTRFTRAYSECPSCVSARRTLLSGMEPSVHGMVGFDERTEWRPSFTLSGLLSRIGFHSYMIGRLAQFPYRRRYGFDNVELADGPVGINNDYCDWLTDQGETSVQPGLTHGSSSRGWNGRPHTLPENRMHTYWCVDRALRFLERRDPGSPFFLTISFSDPKPPFAPPAVYYDRYINEEITQPVVGNWAPDPEKPNRGPHKQSAKFGLKPKQHQCIRAAYYGMINFLDDQIGRLFDYMGKDLMDQTLIVYASDHGEMLGDHNLYGHMFGYESSVRIPYILKPPRSIDCETGIECDAPVGLQDIAPTVLETIKMNNPDGVTGSSLIPLMNEDRDQWRTYLHGEHAGFLEKDDSIHYITDGRLKYIWHSHSGREHLFSVENDPQETNDLALYRDSDPQLIPCRKHLAEVLDGREEGFSRQGELIKRCPHEALTPGKTDKTRPAQLKVVS